MAGSDKSKELKKTKGNYCFPNFLGKAMASVGPRVQFESSLLSMAFILIGLIVISAVTIFGTNLSLFIKIMAGVNAIAAFFFLSSNLVTTFQQYQSYLSVMGILAEEDEKEQTTLEQDKVTEETITPSDEGNVESENDADPKGDEKEDLDII